MLSHLLITAALCATLISCRLEFAADAGTFAPSVREVQTLLDQGRVRLALQRAELLTQRYRGPEAELAHGWALWRTGRVRLAEARFRRAAEAGAVAAYAGLAAARASTAEWDQAGELARTALGAGDSIGAANAVLAAAAWVSGDAREAGRQLQAWGAAEAGTARGRAASAMAAAVSRLDGPSAQWVGEPALLVLRRLDDGGWAVPGQVAGESVLWKLDPTYRQSLLSDQAVARLRLQVDGPSTPVGRAATPRWPALLSPRQTGVESVQFDSLVLHNVLMGVAEAPVGVDGVIGADILFSARWSFDPAAGELALAPPSASVGSLPGVDEGRAVAWLRARLVREGVGAQFFLFPRVSGTVVAAGVDFVAPSRLDLPTFVVPPGSSSAPAPLMLGGWEDEAQWRPASLTGWAVDGGVAPTAVLGRNLLDAWALHWYPLSLQMRLDAPPGRLQ